MRKESTDTAESPAPGHGGFRAFARGDAEPAARAPALPLIEALRHPRVLAFLGVAGLTCVGCGPSGPKLHPVRGTVTVQGKPAHHAIVFLHRTGRKDMTEPVPFGKVDEKGEYVISSSAGTEGAQEGEYVVT